MQLVDIVEENIHIWEGTFILMIYETSKIMNRPGNIEHVLNHTVFGSFQRYAESGYIVLGKSVELKDPINLSKLSADKWFEFFMASRNHDEDKNGISQASYPISIKSEDEIHVYVFR